MPRQLIDRDLLIWEAYPTSGRFGFPDGSRILFNCISDPDRRARFVQLESDGAEAARRLDGKSVEELRALFDHSTELR